MSNLAQVSSEQTINAAAAEAVEKLLTNVNKSTGEANWHLEGYSPFAVVDIIGTVSIGHWPDINGDTAFEGVNLLRVPGGYAVRFIQTAFDIFWTINAADLSYANQYLVEMAARYSGEELVQL